MQTNFVLVLWDSGALIPTKTPRSYGGFEPVTAIHQARGESISIIQPQQALPSAVDR